MNSPILTVFLITYNHEKTIRETLDGIVKQKTKYPFVVKILEDASTDGTLAICHEYADRYPSLIQIIAQPVNTRCAHVRVAIDNEITTPYFTFIEGDDYWINDKHLDKAISFLEKNADYNMYASNMYNKCADFQKDAFESQHLTPEKVGHDISIDNYIYLQTAGRVYRKVFDFKSLPKGTVESDIYLYYLYLDKGKSYFDHEIDHVYRISNTGSWNSLSSQEKRNAFYDVVYTAGKLLNYRHAKFLVKQLPRCKIKKLRKIIGPKLTLRIFVYWMDVKHRHGRAASTNQIYIRGKNTKRVQLNINGENNYIEIDTDTILPSAKITVNIYGHNNRVIIKKGFLLSGRLGILIGQKNNNFGLCNNTGFVIDEYSSVEQMQYITFNSGAYCRIGKNCVFSYGITLYNTDAHPVLDLNTHKVINYVHGIDIGNHVWVGANATILKNTHIAEDCIVGWGSVVSGKYTEPHCAIAGNPARLIKRDITWDPNGAKCGYIENKWWADK